MRESPEKKRKHNVNRSLAAGVAMLAGISAVEAKDAHKTEFSELGQNVLLETEAMIVADKMPLKRQINFLEAALKTGGAYSRELGQIRLTPERLSQINKVANTVSARLTNRYAEKPDDPEMKRYFADAAVLQNATSQFRIPRGSGTEVCNKYKVRDNAEIFEVTAFHCVTGSVYEKDFYRRDGTDMAVRNLSNEELANMTVDLSLLPEVNPNATPQNINGRVVTAFSWSPRGEAKVHFSVAMPMPAKRSLIFSPKDMHAFSAFGVTDMNIFFKPFGEGLRNPETRKTNAAGSSGGPVFASGIGILGNYSATKEVSDACAHVCYAMSFFSGPDVLQRAIAGEREQRARKSTLAKGE